MTRNSHRSANKKPKDILFESDVIGAVREYLESRGWIVVSTCDEYQRGDDLVAEKGREELRVEAKGEGSSKAKSKRYGESFNSSQVSVHVAEAFYRAAAMEQERGCLAGMAFPDNAHYRRYAGRIKNKIAELGFFVFWVCPKKTVLMEPESRKI